MTVPGTLVGVLLFALALAAAVLLMIFVLVPVFRFLGWIIAGIFKGIGWLFVHVFEFIGGMLGDTLRFVGSVLAMVVLMPLAVLNIVIGRWSAAGHFAESVKRECQVGGACLYRLCLRRPLKLLLLHGLLEGVEQRVPEAMAAAPTADKPRRRVGQFPGYRIVGSLRGGGSGAKLYIAEPDAAVRAKYQIMPERVVIKSFALSEGSSLPQIVRESRALESAKQLGLVFDHGMDDRRFFYVMPYHAGDHLGILTRQLHGQTEGRGLERPQLATAMGYIDDLLCTLATYHRGGLWHKDVKPENIIVHDSRAHLVDLGLITPLRSAMTLTTHGTEYFRDPEMVRQALRGVKVHQVNGVKFDVYAAAAVLFFLIENTFPPHGALSRFNRKSPEALRWIVRRGMAEYNNRYGSADEMLADLRYLAAADDPFAVKPAALPSMQGERAVEAVLEEPPAPRPAEPQVAAVAGSPRPPREEDAPDRPQDQAAVAVGVVGGGACCPRPGRRPRLQVTNWWTGEYRVVDPGGDAAEVATPPPPPPEVREARYAAAGFRREAEQIREQVRTGVMSAREAAREQVKAARTRARDIRRRARVHRKAVAERQPSLALVAICVLTLLIVGALMSTMLAVRSRQVGAVAGKEIETLTIGPSADAALPLLVVPMIDDAEETYIQHRIEHVVDGFRDRGYDIIMSDAILDESGIDDLLAEWYESQTAEADDALEDTLADYDLYGLLRVTESHGKVSGNVIRSTRKDATSRRFVVEAPSSAPERPFLLVNDHPAKHAPEVADRVSRMLRQMEIRGWTILEDGEMEAEVRAALPAGSVASDEPLPEMLKSTLRRYDIGGVLYVHARPGDGSPAARVVISPIVAPLPDDEGEAETSYTVTPERKEKGSSSALRITCEHAA